MSLKTLLLAICTAFFVLQGCEFASGPGGGTGGDGLTLTGILRDPQGNPVVGAKVRLYPEEYQLAKGALDEASPHRDSTVTDLAGRFRFSNLASGRYNLEASAMLGDSLFSLFISGIYVGQSVDLGVDTLQTAGSLKIMVQDQGYHALTGARCYIVGSEREDLSDVSGTCFIGGLAPGRYKLLVAYPGMESAVVNNVLVESGGEAQVGVRLLHANAGTDSTWTERYDVEGESASDIAWSGSLLVAVGGGRDIYGEPTALILTSPDGITWTKRSVATTKALSAVAWGGGRFVAMAEDSTVLTSPDGIDWTVRRGGSSYGVSKLIWTGTRFVGVGLLDIVTSPDGVTWTRKDSDGWRYDVAWTGSLLVAVGYDSVLTSPDGITWTRRNARTSNSLHGVAWGNGLLVAVGDYGVIRTSPDGITWTARVSGTTDYFQSVTWIDGHWRINGGELTSTDGILWTPGNNISLFRILKVGTRLVGLGYQGIFTSP